MFSQVLTQAGIFLSDPMLIGLVILGVIVGIIFGMLPGLSSTMSLAVLLPISFTMSPEAGITFLIAVFSASVYGGSLSAILVNIPGTPGAIVTQMDGYPMARKGQAGQAIGYATIASAFGGVFGWLILVLFASLIVRMATSFQSPEFTALILFGLTMLAYAAPGSMFKGMIGGIFGLLLATVGLDKLTSITRFSFGSTDMMGGIGIIPLAVGVFGMAEVLINLEGGVKKLIKAASISRITDKVLPKWRSLIPAAGSAIAVVIAYAQEKRMARHPERFGTGIPEGVVAPESANNACVGGALVPMMTFGIPGDTMTAVLMGGLLIHGLRPGPGLFRDHLPFVATVYIALIFAIIVTTILGLAGARLSARVLSIPKPVLLTSVIVLCIIGSYSVNNSIFDVWIMLTFGIIGYFMYKGGFPVAPVAFGIILGPLFEENLRRSLIVNQGDWLVFLRRPISLTILIVCVVSLLYPVVREWWEGRRQLVNSVDGKE
jgi:putative tricarboxylic transport membrane protein